MPEITISKKGGAVSLQLEYLHERIGTYRVYFDGEPDLALGSAIGLSDPIQIAEKPISITEDKDLYIELVVKEFPEGDAPAGPFAITTWFSQVGWNIPESPDRDSGKLTDGREALINLYYFKLVP
jgi:hypothetical protein